MVKIPHACSSVNCKSKTGIMTQTMFQQDAMIPWLLLGRGSRLVQQLVLGIGPRKGQVDAIQQAAIEVNLPPYLLTFCFGGVIFDPFPERGYNISVSMFFLETSNGLCLGDFEKWQHHHTMNVGLFHCLDVGFLEERGYWKLRQICLAYNSVFANRYHWMLKTADGRVAG